MTLPRSTTSTDAPATRSCAIIRCATASSSLVEACAQHSAGTSTIAMAAEITRRFTMGPTVTWRPVGERPRTQSVEPARLDQLVEDLAGDALEVAASVEQEHEHDVLGRHGHVVGEKPAL